MELYNDTTNRATNLSFMLGHLYTIGLIPALITLGVIVLGAFIAAPFALISKAITENKEND